ncbi:MAG: hypothetical protein D6744_19005 [Planctomycetota bacterium]|nr:MAG: hypothetical protein D6744_19005 [Planctomycetota bacterium]
MRTKAHEFSGVRLAAAVLAAAALAPWALAASINGLHESPRVFNDYPGSTLTITNSNSVNPGSVVIDDRNFGTGGFANRHDIELSSDAGASAHTFSIDDPFTISAEVRLDVGSVSPRKEAGLRINSPITGDALFLINSDAGEIVAFGGGAPFFIFGSNGGGNGYTPGSTILMGMTYTPSGGGANGVPGTIEYFIDRGAGLETSGPLNWANLEGGPVDFNVAMYGQFAPVDNNDFGTASFNNISYIPEPGAALLLLLPGMALMRRRGN